MITPEEFNSAIKEATTMTKWRDLEVGRIYKIVGFDVFDTQVGESMKLTVEDGDNVLYTMWAPNRVKETLEGKEYTHIRCNGLKKCRGGNNSYWSFNAVKIEKKDMFS